MDVLYILYIIESLVLAQESPQCEYSFKEQGYDAEYDVCDLVLTGSKDNTLDYYTVYDARNQYESYDIRYRFNLFEPILSWPPDSPCSEINTGPCIEYSPDGKTCNKIQPIENKIWIYQETVQDGQVTQCKHVNNAGYDAPISWALLRLAINEKYLNPSQGIVLYMFGGDYDDSCIDKNSKNIFFQISLECFDQIGNVPDTEMVYWLNDRCELDIYLESILGCPLQCGRRNGRLCNAKGTCGYDFDKGTIGIAKCFCYNGWSGDSCSIHDTTASTPKQLINPTAPSSDYSKIFTVDDGDGNVLYDLSIWHLDGADYKIKDTATDWIFYLNLADHIDPNILPKPCLSATKPCVKFDEIHNECLEYSSIGNGIGVAFRFNEISRECQLVATELKWELYDDSNPAHGVRMVGYNGGYCGGSNSPINKNRVGTFNFICVSNNAISLKPDKELETYVYKNDTFGCSFTIWYQNGAQCPWNCINKINNEEYMVCNGHGTCAFDAETNFVRCLCNEGWSGLSCDKVTPAGGGGGDTFIFTEDTWLLIATVALLVLFCIVSVVFWKCYLKIHNKLKKIEALDNNRLINDADKLDVKSNITVYSDDKSENSKGSMSSGNSNDSVDSQNEENNLLKN